jgi:acetyl esterase/lipase
VVLIHGGGFTQQTRKDPGIARTARGLAEEGVAVAAIDYRLLGSAPKPSRRVAPLVAKLPAVPSRRRSLRLWTTR